MAPPPLLTTVELLDMVRAHLVSIGKPDSDYQVHKALEVSQPTVSDWRKGHTTMGEDVALRVAKLLGLSQDYVMACIFVERAKSDATRAFWRDLALRSTRAVALAALVVLPCWLGALQ